MRFSLQLFLLKFSQTLFSRFRFSSSHMCVRFGKLGCWSIRPCKGSRVLPREGFLVERLLACWLPAREGCVGNVGDLISKLPLNNGGATVVSAHLWDIQTMDLGAQFYSSIAATSS